MRFASYDTGAGETVATHSRRVATHLRKYNRKKGLVPPWMWTASTPSFGRLKLVIRVNVNRYDASNPVLRAQIVICAHTISVAGRPGAAWKGHGKEAGTQ